MRLKTKAKKKKGRRNICKEGRENKPKIQACLNSQVTEEKLKKQNKRKKGKKVIYNNESTLTKTLHDPQSVSTRYFHFY